MDAALKIICQALKEEAEALIKCTDAIAELAESQQYESVVATFELNRLDRIGYIQNLTLELTNLMSGSEPPGEQKEA